jgi:hypothetical protein
MTAIDGMRVAGVPRVVGGRFVALAGPLTADLARGRSSPLLDGQSVVVSLLGVFLGKPVSNERKPSQTP